MKSLKKTKVIQINTCKVLKDLSSSKAQDLFKRKNEIKKSRTVQSLDYNTNLDALTFEHIRRYFLHIFTKTTTTKNKNKQQQQTNKQRKKGSMNKSFFFHVI
jgi:hypothetical protein